MSLVILGLDNKSIERFLQETLLICLIWMSSLKISRRLSYKLGSFFSMELHRFFSKFVRLDPLN